MTNKEAIDYFTSSYAIGYSDVERQHNEAVKMAIQALEKLDAIESNKPDSDDWEHYADRLHDIAYKNGYEQAQKDLVCEDAISRQAVLKQLEGCLTGGDTEYKYVKLHIDSIPPVSPARPTKWIPVSERLPKETGWYLVTFKTYDGKRAVCELSYRKPEDYWTGHDVRQKALDNNDVIAWMPLPEPYKAESENKE